MNRTTISRYRASAHASTTIAAVADSIRLMSRSWRSWTSITLGAGNLASRNALAIAIGLP